MSVNGGYRCPLCESLIDRKVYERVLRIDEARKAEVAAEREEIQRQLAQVERQREKIAKRAAETERRKVLAESSKVQKRLNDEIARMRSELRQEQERHERAVAAQVRTAKQEASRPLLKVISGLRQSAREAAADAAAGVKRLTRELDLAKKSAETERKRTQRDAEARIRAAKEAAEQPHLRVIEKLNGQLKVLEERRRREVESLNRAIADLKQKADAHDHAHFGPEGEEELVAALRHEFRGDQIEHRGKGGDVIQTVLESGMPLGKIVYECKRTATWQVAFTRQLKKAMETHDTRYGVLISRKLPRKAAGICTANKVLVSEPHLAVQLASVLRDAVVALGRARMSEDGKAAKTEEIYRYLCSDDFSNAISRIDDKIKELRGSLEKERSSHDGWWRAREQHYATILREASGIDARVKEILSARPAPVLAKLRPLRQVALQRSQSLARS